ncbi:hydroxyacid dehydrogenase [Alistipes sp. Z76]|nr:hydroxyacid dehydrogenase [Alistipes sp. Z76]NCE70108.1 hydroxyacid dehydrogenase [Muribaculaceae bacterium M3]
MEQKLILYNSDDGKSCVSLLARDGSVWLNQSQLAELFATSKQAISYHIDNILVDNELAANQVVKDYLTTASDGKQYTIKFYSLEMILSVGFRIRNPRGVQFRQWANRNLSEYLRKGFIIDDERLKNPDGRPDYFDELLARIRDIRASEKRFYQKVRDLFALSSDYDKTDKATQMFYAETQNKLLYAVTGKTSGEIIMQRADAKAPNMGLTSWKGSIVRKQDVAIAKNYLTHDELDSLNRLVVIFLETAEFRAKNRNDLTMVFWRENVDKILLSNDQRLLSNAGSVSKQQREDYAYRIYDEFDARRKHKDAIDADREDMEQLKELEAEIKLRIR